MLLHPLQGSQHQPAAEAGISCHGCAERSPVNIREAHGHSHLLKFYLLWKNKRQENVHIPTCILQTNILILLINICRIWERYTHAWYTHVPTETITLVLFLNGLVCLLSTICSPVWVSSCLSVSLQISCWLWCAFPWKQAKPRSLVSPFSKLSYRDQLTSVSSFLGSEGHDQ